MTAHAPLTAAQNQALLLAEENRLLRAEIAAMRQARRVKKQRHLTAGFNEGLAANSDLAYQSGKCVGRAEAARELETALKAAYAKGRADGLEAGDEKHEADFDRGFLCGFRQAETESFAEGYEEGWAAAHASIDNEVSELDVEPALEDGETRSMPFQLLRASEMQHIEIVKIGKSTTSMPAELCALKSAGNFTTSDSATSDDDCDDLETLLGCETPTSEPNLCYNVGRFDTPVRLAKVSSAHKSEAASFSEAGTPLVELPVRFEHQVFPPL